MKLKSINQMKQGKDYFIQKKKCCNWCVVGYEKALKIIGQDFKSWDVYEIKESEK